MSKSNDIGWLIIQPKITKNGVTNRAICKVLPTIKPIAKSILPFPCLVNCGNKLASIANNWNKNEADESLAYSKLLDESVDTVHKIVRTDGDANSREYKNKASCPRVKFEALARIRIRLIESGKNISMGFKLETEVYDIKEKKEKGRYVR